MHNIKIVRLQNGEDVISTCYEDVETKMIMLKDPMTIIFKRIKEGSILLITPWLPTELIEDNTATLLSSDILTTVEPKTMIKDYYVKLVDKLQLFKKEEEDILKRFLEDDSDNDDYEEYEGEELDEINEVYGSYEPKKNIKLH
jgi:hypothetical protein